MTSDEKEPIHMKLSLIGDGYVGKTSLRRQYLGLGFETEYLETLGADFTIKTIKHNNYDFRYQIWDIAGQPRFAELRKTFFIGSQASLVLFDVTKEDSFNNINNWLNELWIHNGKGKKVPIIIIGNKIDLRSSIDNTISKSQGKELAKKLTNDHGLSFDVEYLETSAKTGVNVSEAFNLITNKFIKIYNL